MKPVKLQFVCLICTEQLLSNWFEFLLNHLGSFFTFLNQALIKNRLKSICIKNEILKIHYCKVKEPGRTHCFSDLGMNVDSF